MRDLNLFRYDPGFAAVALEGAPVGGKSTFLAVSRQWLEDHGNRVALLPEAATELIMAGFSPVDDWRHGDSFSDQAFSYMVERENRYYRMMKARRNKGWKKLVMLCDRTIPGLQVYVGRDEYLKMLERRRTTPIDVLERYKIAINMVTTAEGMEEVYLKHQKNNPARNENLETPSVAREMDRLGRRVWSMHPHFFNIDNSTDFDTKIRRAVSALARVLDMPEPTEIERKFRVLNFRPEMIPEDAVDVDIIQDYLYPYGEYGEKECRVRKRTLDGSSSYYYTEKTDSDDPAVRGERERQISLAEYERLRRRRDPSLKSVVKTRYGFTYQGHHIELDVYPSGLVILEVELRDKDEYLELPPWWDYEEVTGDKRYKNRAIAGGSLDRLATA